MHAGIHDSVTDRAVAETGRARSAEAEMPAWQQQHPRLPRPTIPAHPLPATTTAQNHIRRRIFRRRRAPTQIVAAAARFRVAVVAGVRQHLL